MTFPRMWRHSRLVWRSRLTRIAGDGDLHRADADVWVALDDSVVGRVLSRVTQLFFRAAAHSAGLRYLAHVRATWAACLPVERMRAIGATAVVAVMVHLAMMSSHPLVGWWWLVVPGLVLAFGVCAVVLSLLGSNVTRTGV